jgi:tetratricopeptide (TPR) repeat protein
MVSPFIERVDRELAGAVDPVKKAALLAQKGCYLARVGGFEEPQEIVSLLRKSFGDGSSARTTIWIMLLEGLLHYYQHLSQKGFDRVMRAQALSLAIRDTSLSALSSAWRAHFEFEKSDYAGMARSLKLALDNANSSDHDAHTRLSMTLADAFLTCGDRFQSQIWYQRSRNHALDSGDQATISALMYNRAAFGLAQLRAQNCISSIAVDVLRMLRLEVASATNFQEMIRLSSLHNLIGLWEARLFLLEEKFSLAITSLSRVRNDGPFPEASFSPSYIDLEIAFCHVKLGRFDEAFALFQTIPDAGFSELDVDEQLAACWMRADMCRADARFGDAAALAAKLGSIRVMYEASCAELSSAIEPFRIQ